MKTATPAPHSKILILDFGSQYTQVIARRIRELQVYSEIVPFDLAAKAVAQRRPNGIILSGGPASVYDKDAPRMDPEIFSLGIPVLGICYGLMLMAHHLEGKVEFSGRREYGAGILHVTPDLIAKCQPELRGWFSQDNPFSWALDKFALAPNIRRFDNGTPGVMAAIASLPALDWHAGQDQREFVRHNRTLTAQLIAAIDALGLTLKTTSSPTLRT